MPPENDGVSSPQEKLSAADEDVLLRLFEDWERLAEDEDILPPLSPLASRLLAVEHEDAEAITELTQIVESDPILTGRILGLGNSVTVRVGGKPIFEVVGAVIRLGVNAVFEAAFAQQSAQALQEHTQLRHDISPDGFMNRAMMSEIRTQFSASAASCFWPARVMA